MVKSQTKRNGKTVDVNSTRDYSLVGLHLNLFCLLTEPYHLSRDRQMLQFSAFPLRPSSNDNYKTGLITMCCSVHLSGVLTTINAAPMCSGFGCCLPQSGRTINSERSIARKQAEQSEIREKILNARTPLITTLSRIA